MLVTKYYKLKIFEFLLSGRFRNDNTSCVRCFDFMVIHIFTFFFQECPPTPTLATHAFFWSENNDKVMMTTPNVKKKENYINLAPLK